MVSLAKIAVRNDFGYENLQKISENLGVIYIGNENRCVFGDLIRGQTLKIYKDSGRGLVLVIPKRDFLFVTLDSDFTDIINHTYSQRDLLLNFLSETPIDLVLLDTNEFP